MTMASKIRLSPAMEYAIQETIFDSMEECGSCGAWHPIDFNGDCRNDAMRYHPEDLMELIVAAVPTISEQEMY